MTSVRGNSGNDQQTRPPSAGQELGTTWIVTCGLLVFPFAAILHNVVFHARSCMLNPFGVTEWDYVAIDRWLARDPSLPWALLGAVGVYVLGRRYALIEAFALPFFLGFFPFSVWIWDIPFTKRYICRTWHDNHLILFGHAISTRHFYMLGIVLTAAHFALNLYRRRKANGNPLPKS